MFSKIVVLLCTLLLAYASFIFYPRWQKQGTQATIAWDVSGYYWYLPSIFIYKDLKHQSFKDSILNKYSPTNTEFQQGFKVSNGNYVMKYSSGMAVMYLPFFAVAHILARPLGFPPDGFSPPYQFAIQFGGFLISILGLWYLRKLLRSYYSDLIVGITIFTLVLGTNYLNYAGIDMSISHTWLFTVYVFIILNTHFFYKTYYYKYAVRIGLLIGLAVLTRPTEIIAILIPLLWGMERLSFNAVKERILLFKQHFMPILVCGLCAAMVIAIQPLYWKYASGHWLVYSYQNQKFSFTAPHFTDYTFNYSTGWLVYTPMMFFSFIAIIPFLKYGSNKVAILAFFFLDYYIVCSWDFWQYGGRAMVQSYPILIFPIASLIQVILSKKLLGWVLAPYMLFLYFNIWVVYHYHKGGLLDPDCMTKRYFWRVAGRWSAPENTIILNDEAYLFESTLKNKQLLYQNNFETDTGDMYISNGIDGVSLRLDKQHQSSPEYKFAINNNGTKWLRVEATFHCDDKEGYIWRIPQFVSDLRYKGKEVRMNFMRVDRLLNDNATRRLFFDVKPPEEIYDTVSIHLWNAESDKTILMDDLKVWSFTP